MSLPAPVRVHVPFTRRGALGPLPVEPPATLFLTELPPAALQPLDPPAPPLQRSLTQALLWRALGGGLSGLVLVSASLIGLLTQGPLSALERLAAVCTLMLLLWPLLSLGTALLRLSALHIGLMWQGLERHPLEQSLRAGLEGSASRGALAWVPGLGVAGLVLAECEALAALHRLPQHRVLGLALALIALPFASSMMSGLILAMLLV
ncbi:MAG: hypothetical protein H6741_09045 [Alphaproteobacteria bacterium]|nr:hypothetical protein [Alphaproteobacteria bacterium]